ncbi:MAG TPA: hypothetical protein VFV31_09345 [Chitinophagaceae bacterium]|nr:hypothetical protein [Chitinophagaceae bacterium]
MNKSFFESAKVLIGLFVVVTIVAVAVKDWLVQYHIDWRVVALGNFLLFDTGILSLFIMTKTLQSTNPQAFVRAMYGSFIVKFFVLAIAAFVYIMVTKKNVNKEALIICAGLYVVYAFLETRILTKLLKGKDA